MKKKIIIGSVIAVVLIAIVTFTVTQGSRNAITVQTGQVAKQDLATVVSASGEIKPLTYVNVGANAFGKIVKLYVKEGDHVKKGQLLAQLEQVQSAADVAMQRATVGSSKTDAVAAEAGVNTAVADLNRARADAERTKLDYDRASGLFKEKLIAKADFDTKKAAYDVAAAQVIQAEAKVAQDKAQVRAGEGAVRRLAQDDLVIARGEVGNELENSGGADVRRLVGLVVEGHGKRQRHGGDAKVAMISYVDAAR